nr:unnamed protein product [Callosobruchus analis]
MIYSRGNRLDYDLWEAMGNPGWSYKDVLPYFLKSEGASIAVNDSGYHNKDGPLGVSDLPYRTKSATVFLEAAQEAGYPYVDYNGGADSLVWLKTNLTDQDYPTLPDIELMFEPVFMGTDFGMFMRINFNVGDEIYDTFWKPFLGKPAFQVVPMLMHPRSRGRMRLRSKDPFEAPKYFENFFSDPEGLDIKRIIVAVRETQRIASQPTFQKYGAKLIDIPIPGESCMKERMKICIHYETTSSSSSSSSSKSSEDNKFSNW